jgi:hypothetical protein
MRGKLSRVDRVYAVTATKRRRYIWAAWWTGEPTREPFRKPDAWIGGARTPAEARAAAERAAGGPLGELDSMWVRAWLRIQRGQAPWIAKPPKPPPEARDPRPVAGRFVVPRGTSPFAVLGLTPMASPAEIKRAFRRLALATHPDRGGEARAFMLAKWAHDEAMRQSGALR